MADKTMTPVQLAGAITRRLPPKSAPVSDKTVRGRARALIERYNKAKHPEHQSHAYTPAEQAMLTRVILATRGVTVAAPRKPRRSRKATDASVAAD